MKASQLTRGEKRRLMHVEGKEELIDGARARIGWVTFSKSGRSVYYRGLTLSRLKGGGISGNFFHAETGTEFWVSGVKRKGSNSHPAEHRIDILVDDDARAAYEEMREGVSA